MKNDSKKHNFLVVTFFLVIFLFISNLVKAEEENSDNISTEIQKLKQDLKTLEKAVYKSSQITTSSNSSSNSLNEDILTRHLLKLNEIETQFQNLTNKFEEVNFKMDKLSKRITKMQTDNQMRFSDLENNPENIVKDKKISKRKNYPELISRTILVEYQMKILKIQTKFKKHNQLSLLD